MDIILHDFAKVFYKVLHSRLLYKMEYYGIWNHTTAWIRAFLGNRKQEVILDGACSSQADFLSGVPKGTVLGPLLFFAQINDLSESLRNSHDSLFYCIVNKDTERDLLQRDVAALEEWEDT